MRSDFTASRAVLPFTAANFLLSLLPWSHRFCTPNSSVHAYFFRAHLRRRMPVVGVFSLFLEHLVSIVCHVCCLELIDRGSFFICDLYAINYVYQCYREFCCCAFILRIHCVYSLYCSHSLIWILIYSGENP